MALTLEQETNKLLADFKKYSTCIHYREEEQPRGKPDKYFCTHLKARLTSTQRRAISENACDTCPHKKTPTRTIKKEWYE